MKNISRFFVAALAFVGVTSCNTAPVEEVNLSTTTITASFADSRTTLSDGVKTLWAEYDAIEVNGVTFTLSAGAGEATATFTSTTPLAAAESYTATYPAGVTTIAKSQIALAGTFDPEAALAVATGNDANNLVFEHRHALLKFELAAPAAKVAILDYEIAASNGNMEAQTVYYLAVEAGTYAGLTATVDGVAVKSTENSVEIANGKILNLGTLPNGTAVEQKGIRTAADLVAFAANPAGDEYKDENGVINILADIDMKDVEWTPITDFTGTLDGNNHTIDNLVVSDATHAAMFKNLSDATIQNLVMGEGCSFTVTNTTATASYAGAIVGQILTGATIKNVKNYATISGAVSCGGICGAANLKKKAILFEDCANYGSVTFPAVAAPADLKLGGICGASEKLVTIKNCVNYGDITTKSTSGNKYNMATGIVAAASDTHFIGCSNHGVLGADVRNSNNVYLGGITGRTFRNIIENCSNNGSLSLTEESTFVNLYAGGIVSNVRGSISDNRVIKGCSNTGNFAIDNNNFTGNLVVAGIVGWFEIQGVYIDECSNAGNITVSTTTYDGSHPSYVGGIVGLVGITANENAKYNSRIYKCTNSGTIAYVEDDLKHNVWLYSGGIVGGSNSDSTSLCTIEECTNNGIIKADTWTRALVSGIVGHCYLNVTNCVNNGTIYTTSKHTDYYTASGGIVSRLRGNVTVSGCKNYGTIVYAGLGFTLGDNLNKNIVCAAGIVAQQEKGTIENCENYGAILSNDYDESHGKYSYVNAKGTISGWVGQSEKVTIKNCKIGGVIGSCVETDADFGAAKATAITAENYASYIYGGDAKNGVTVTDCVFGAAN